MKKSSLKFLKIPSIMLLGCFALVFESNAQTITAGPVITTESNLYTDIELWISAPAGEEVNAQFHYYTGESDTLSTIVLTNLSLGFSQEFVFQDLVVNCDSLWNGYVDVWVTGQDTIQSNPVSWSLPCPGNVSLDFSAEEIVDLGVVTTFNYNTGGALAALYWLTSIDGGTPFLQTVLLFGEGTYSDTLFISAGQTYQVCNPEINNGFTNPLFILDCMSGTMDSFVATTPVVALVTTIANDTLLGSFTIQNSGGLNSEFTVTIEKMICGGNFEPYEDFVFIFTNEIIVDSTISIPILINLPNAPAWKVTVAGLNESFSMSPISTIVDVALTSNPTVSVELVSTGNGYYEAHTTWNDDGAGNVSIAYYVNDEFVGEVFPTTSPFTYVIPTQISSYSDGSVEAVLGSNACSVSVSLQVVESCSSEPAHILETATQITETSATVQLAYVNFGGCVEEAMVGIILVGIDTVWSPLSVNTEESANYIVQLTNLTPGQTYVYLGVLYAEGEYFTTNFSLSFTTLSDEPVPPSFTNFSVNWDMSMLITIFTYYDLGDFSSVSLRVYHDGPGNPAVEIVDIPVMNQFTSIDYNLAGQYGTHLVWAELYDTGTNVVFETTDVSIYTFQQPIGIVEIGRTIERFDRIEVYNLAGQLVGNYRNGEILNPEFSQGVYLFVGLNGGEPSVSKLNLNN